MVDLRKTEPCLLTLGGKTRASRDASKNAGKSPDHVLYVYLCENRIATLNFPSFLHSTSIYKMATLEGPPSLR